jgi:hypothetical protein
VFMPILDDHAKDWLMASILELNDQSLDRVLRADEAGISWEWGKETQTLPDSASHSFRNLVSKLSKRREFRDRFSEHYIQNLLARLLWSARNAGADETRRLLDSMCNELDTFDIEHTVYIPIVGAYLAVDELPLGRVVLRKTDQVEVAHIVELAEPTPANLDIDDEKDERKARRQRELSKRLGGKTCAVMTIVAEPRRALERATEETRRALELLMFANTSSLPFHPQADAVITIDGEAPTTMSTVVSATAGALHWSSSRARTLWHVQISGVFIEEAENLGLMALSNMLAKPRELVTEMEEALLRSVHWFAASQAQSEPENRLLNLVTALEALVGPTDRLAIGTSIAENTALILGETYSERQEIKRFILSLYNARSGISHGGEKQISEGDIIEARRIVCALITELLQWTPQILDKQQLMNWFERARLSGNTLAPAALDQNEKTLKQLRLDRGWTFEEVARQLDGFDAQDVRAMEDQPAANLDVSYLRKISDTFEVGLDEIVLPRNAVWTCVRGHRFLLISRRTGAGKWVASARSWDKADATEWPCRAIDPRFPDVDSPTIFLSPVWETTGHTASMALDAMSSRLTAAMERALTRDRLPEDPPDWQPPPIPRHWQNHLQAIKPPTLSDHTT